MSVAGVEMALTYHFEPGSPRDGVTLAVPLYALNQVSAARSEWLVPGMLKEKVHLLLKSLPQKLRRHCVPLPDYAAGFCERTDAAHGFGKAALLDTLIADIREQTGIAVKLSDFKLETLPAHHFMNFKVIDEHGRQLDMGRNLAALQSEFGGQARESFQRLAETVAVTPGAASAGTYGVAPGQGGITGGAKPVALLRRRGQAGPGADRTAGRRRAAKPHDLVLRRIARTAGNPARQANPDRLPGAGGQRAAIATSKSSTILTRRPASTSPVCGG